MNNTENDNTTVEIPLQNIDEISANTLLGTQDDTILIEEPFFCENGCYGHCTEIYNPSETMRNFHVNHFAFFYCSFFVFACIIIGCIVISLHTANQHTFYDNKISEDK